MSTGHFPTQNPSRAPRGLLDRAQALEPGAPEAASLAGTHLSGLISLPPPDEFSAPAKLDLHLVP